ncbi:site-specific integrase [Alisedimentitalea sp. MJ-SS2]|uniref:site-specific integrase n=1 Tax=Aliisedimentitalea sp. MJ-SS2 TaxID=3049795 RepID=UPI002907012F|nr:site-specific integrase [Alisedimentitalea sp. MJ-SS2]MDU8928266.1 site-specific integrase [Alisedimentitalea sp. MJ-SS2]
MTKRNSENTQIKRKYFAYLRGAEQLSEASVEKAAASLTFFETAMGYKDFKRHNLTWPERFKEVLAEATNRSGKPLSVSTQSNHMRHVRTFIRWLADKPGYKSRIGWSDANYYRLSRKEERIASEHRDPVYPLLEHSLKAFRAMPADAELQRRDKAIFAFFLMTGARVTATASLKLKRINLAEKTVSQDARDVDTKGAKTFLTAFYINAPDVWQAFVDWVVNLYDGKYFGPEDPLFPKTFTSTDVNGHFVSKTVARAHWDQTASMRTIIKGAFLRAHMPAYGPHSFRHMLTHVGMDICPTPRAFKAWSQNFGHSDVATTLNNYGRLTSREQVEEIAKLSKLA